MRRSSGPARSRPSPGGSIEVRPVMDYEASGSEEHTSAEAVS